jgi:hypothetical protein
MLQTKGVRVLTYFVAVLLIAWVVTIAFSHRQQSIAAFAFAVLGLSLLMPALRFELDGLWVDTIYYVAAALAAVMFFIAEEPEQTIVHLQTTLDEDSRSKVQSERKSLKLENEATKNAKHLAINTRFLQEISETLAQDWAKTLMAEEERLAGSLINSLKQLEFFAVWVAAENAQCVRTLDVLAMEQAFIRHEEEQRQQRSGFRDEIPDLSAGIQQEMFDREIDRCGRISTMQSRIDALGPGYERVIGLLDLSNDTYLTAALTGHASPSFVLSETDREQIDSISRLLELRRSHEMAKSARATLTETADDLSAQISAETAEVAGLNTKIEDTNAALSAAKDLPLAGLALSVKNWMTFRWPYFLIAFLGLKLARKPVYLLR